jgi:hypothetical protein
MTGEEDHTEENLTLKRIIPERTSHDRRRGSYRREPHFVIPVLSGMTGEEDHTGENLNRKFQFSVKTVHVLFTTRKCTNLQSCSVVNKVKLRTDTFGRQFHVLNRNDSLGNRRVQVE